MKRSNLQVQVRLSLAELPVVELPVVRHRVGHRVRLIARQNWRRGRQEKALGSHRVIFRELQRAAKSCKELQRVAESHKSYRESDRVRKSITFWSAGERVDRAVSLPVVRVLAVDDAVPGERERAVEHTERRNAVSRCSSVVFAL